MTELAFAIFGFLLGLLPSWFNRKRRLKTHWCALRAEMMLCKEKAELLLNDNVMSPLYRLPVIAYQVSYPVVLADGAVAEEEVPTNAVMPSGLGRKSRPLLTIPHGAKENWLVKVTQSVMLPRSAKRPNMALQATPKSGAPELIRYA